jgi:cellulose synthase/poly-beta-1,6-N-acetylglucosamine synthase-like glycosyltransferase
VTALGVTLILVPVLLGLYAYGVYPALLWLLARGRAARPMPMALEQWPFITISLPAYNERDSIGQTIQSLLELDYPADRRQILVISDASTDGTDEVVQGFADRGVELLRLGRRSGKTGAENAAVPHYRGEIIVNTDATIRIPRTSLKPLIAVFNDPAIGLSSGRDVSVGDLKAEANQGESGYVGYEMWVRSLETRLDSIVGASGCFYAIRRHLLDGNFPEGLSRDFGSALLTREGGLRAVSVDPAVCLVPRARSLKAEFRRKVRTMARGLGTLYYKRHLLNPFSEGAFAWMLLSHKLIRWLVFPAMPLALVGFALLASQAHLALAGVLLPAVFLGLGALAWRWPEGKKIPFWISLPGFIVLNSVAAILAWRNALRGDQIPIWEPTRRPAIPS